MSSAWLNFRTTRKPGKFRGRLLCTHLLPVVRRGACLDDHRIRGESGRSEAHSEWATKGDKGAHRACRSSAGRLPDLSSKGTGTTTI